MINNPSVPTCFSMTLPSSAMSLRLNGRDQQTTDGSREFTVGRISPLEYRIGA